MDQKGRLRLPSGLISTQEIGSFIVTNSIFKGEKGLDLYTDKGWEELQTKMSGLPQFDSKIQSFQRFYISSAQVISKDNQDRLLIPTQLREFAGLDSKIVAIGMGNKIELWNENVWQKIFSEISNSYEDILQAVSLFQKEKKT